MSKTYVPRSSAKEVKFRDGGSMIKISFKVEDLISFCQQHKNERGYINMDISKRREVSERGDTHSISLNDWKPDFNQARQQIDKPKQGVLDADAPYPPAPDQAQDEVPF